MRVALVIVGVAIVVISMIVFMNHRSIAGSTAENTTIAIQNVTTVDGKQIVTITTKGGYTPVKSVAKSGIPTILRFETNGTFDCSSSVRIPHLNIDKVLPSTGTTDIEIGTQSLATLEGTCAMGMYHFAVTFE
jgi:plastocyanin domain-containing protein